MKWEEPAPARTTQNAVDYPGIAAELKAHPNQWAVVRPDCTNSNVANQTAIRIRHGNIPFFRPPGSFEAVSRRTGDTYATYARYIGEEGT